MTYDASKQHEVLEKVLLEKTLEEKRLRGQFQIGDKVKILTEVFLNKRPQRNVKGVVEAIDGSYIMVRPNYYKHFIECYPNELEKI